MQGVTKRRALPSSPSLAFKKTILSGSFGLNFKEFLTWNGPLGSTRREDPGHIHPSSVEPLEGVLRPIFIRDPYQH